MMYRLPQLTVLATITVAAAAQSAYGQCTDGSSPPCRTQVVAATPRRDPPLDERTWIVVPFDNLNGSQDAEWLRAGSVNLLYLGMSRWTDLRVIDDERVADYMREVPGASAAKSLALNAGIAVAKRAGAGRLVMGDVIKLGNRTTVNAKIFDVKTGQRLRSVREETSVPDSMMSMFGKLSQKVLNVATPAGGGAGIVGTNSIAAYQAYAEGMQALNQFELPKARTHFNRALELDSAFALPHAKLTVLLGWIAAGDPGIRLHAEAAGRLSGTLPPRERALIEASVAFARQDYVRACAGFSDLVRRDSSDTDAWYGLGDCLFHDTALEPIDGDSTRVRWRANRNASLRAFRQVLALDRTYHLAYQHIVDAYSAQTIGRSFCVSGKCTQYVAIVRPSGDSLLTTPLANPRDTALIRAHLDEYLHRGARRELLTRGRDIAEGWVGANPSEGRARLMYANTLASLGAIAAADSNLRRAVITDSSNAGINTLLLRLELAVKSWRGAEASRMYDSVRAHSQAVPGTGGRITTGAVAVVVAPTFGRLAHFDSLMTVGMRTGNVGPVRERLSREAIRTMMGAPVDSFPAALSAFYNDMKGTAGSVVATRAIAPLLGYVTRRPTDSWPAFDTTVHDLRTAPMKAILRNDTLALRNAAQALDSLSRVYIGALLPDSGLALAAAEAYLALGDSLSALTMTRRWLDQIVPYTPMVVGQSGGTFVQPLTPRAILLRADLAAGLGLNAEARLWYDRFLGFWENADPLFQPLVDRAKKARALLGGGV